MDKVINNWLASSRYDFKTAEAIYKSRRYVYVIFMCHLAIEKTLKAIVAAKTRRVPPKTHDLLLLVKLASLDIPETHRGILMRLNQASIPTRYPEDIAKLIKYYNRPAADKYLQESRGFLGWLRKQIR